MPGSDIREKLDFKGLGAWLNYRDPIFTLSSPIFFFNLGMGAGEIAQWLITHTAPAEDPASMSGDSQ